MAVQQILVFLHILLHLNLCMQVTNGAGGSSKSTDLLQTLAKQLTQKTVLDLASNFVGPRSNKTGNAPGNTGSVFQSYLSELNKLQNQQGQNITINEQCIKHVNVFEKAVNANERWAVQMLDAMGKPPSGLMEANLQWVGNWHECLDTDAIPENRSITEHSTDPLFSGKYCTATLPMQLGQATKASLSIGLCIPSTCSTGDVQTLFKMGIPEVRVSCHEPEDSLDARAIVAIVISAVILLLMLISTVFDAIYINWIFVLKQRKAEAYSENGNAISDHPMGLTEGNGQVSNSYSLNQTDKENIKYKPGLATQALLSFSLYTNISKLFNTNQSKSSLTAINGIRFITMTWIIVGHGFGVVLRPVTENGLVYGQEVTARREFAVVLNANFAVDTFYVLSGLLVSYLSLQELKKRKGAKNFRWILFYFHRFWRLTPPYMLVLMLYICIYKYTISGPFRHQEADPDVDCYEGWWKNLLYVNNFVKGKKGQLGCMSWSWYLATDMQMYIVSPLMFVPLFYSRVFGGLACLAFLLVSMVSSGIITSYNDLPAYNMFDRSKALDFGWDYYVKPWCRIGPYVCGVITGYLLYKYRTQMKMHWLVVAVGWIVSIVTGCLIIYGLYSSDMSNPLSPEISALFNATARTAWGACICWVILSCATGYGGIINRFLSWSAFVPLGRLTYMAYLVHPIMEKIAIYGQLKPAVLYDYGMVYTMLGHIVTSYGAAFLLSMAFEVPMTSLEKVVLGRGKRG